MKNVNATKILILLFFFALLNMRTGCFKEGVEKEVQMQENLLSPIQAGLCWVLASRSDSEEYKYYLRYYSFRTKLVQDNSNTDYLYYSGSTENTNESDPVTGTFLLKTDYIDKYKIDNNIMDCSPYDIYEAHHTFFKTSDYLNFNRKTLNLFSPNNFRIKVSDAKNPSIKDSSFYYYEELYFDPSGKFKKKIFLDPGSDCKVFTITGNWIFRTPFANYDQGIGMNVAEIILNYDYAPVVGLPLKGNIYKLSFYDDNTMVLFQNTIETDSINRAVRSHYTFPVDHIIYSPNIDAIQHYAAESDITYNGRVINHWTSVCGFIVDKRGDMIEIEDPIELLNNRETRMKSVYQVKPPKLCTTNSCPLFCGLKICGTFNADIFSSDNISLNKPHKSDISITADSTLLTITNFANMGQTLNIVMTPHVWFSCYTDAFDVSINGTLIKFQWLTVETINSKQILVAEYKISGVTYKVHYTL